VSLSLYERRGVGEGVRVDRRTVEGVMFARARGVAWGTLVWCEIHLLAFTHVTNLCGALPKRRELGHIKAWHLREVAEARIVDIGSSGVWVEVGYVGLHAQLVLIFIRFSSLMTSVAIRVLHESVRCHCQSFVVTQLSAASGRGL
jgi:hypothetical protein